MEAFSAHRRRSEHHRVLHIKENSPTSFVLEPTVPAMTGARTLTLDSKTNRVLLMAFEL